MANEEDDVELAEENILYDLTVQAEWPQESEIFVRLPFYSLSLFMHHILS